MTGNPALFLQIDEFSCLAAKLFPFPFFLGSSRMINTVSAKRHAQNMCQIFACWHTSFGMIIAVKFYGLFEQNWGMDLFSFEWPSFLQRPQDIIVHFRRRKDATFEGWAAIFLPLQRAKKRPPPPISWPRKKRPKRPSCTCKNIAPLRPGKTALREWTQSRSARNYSAGA